MKKAGHRVASLTQPGNSLQKTRLSDPVSPSTVGLSCRFYSSFISFTLTLYFCLDIELFRTSRYYAYVHNIHVFDSFIYDHDVGGIRYDKIMRLVMTVTQ